MNSPIKKRTFSAKNCYRYAIENNSELKNISFDAELAGYLLNPQSSEYSIQKLCGEYEIPYFSDIESLSSLCDNLYQSLKEQDNIKLLEEVEIPFTEVLASMELRGEAETSGERETEERGES